MHMVRTVRGDLLVLPSLTSFMMSFDISLYFSCMILSSWRRTPRRCRFWSSWSRHRELQWEWHKCTCSRCSLATCVKTNKKFKVCKSVHHRTIQINHQPDVTFFQFIILTFIYSSTCFGRSPAHHQELNDCSSSLWFYLRIVVIAVLCSWSARPLTRGCYCSHRAPDDGRENARNMLSCKQSSG